MTIIMTNCLQRLLCTVLSLFSSSVFACHLPLLVIGVDQSLIFALKGLKTLWLWFSCMCVCANVGESESSRWPYKYISVWPAKFENVTILFLYIQVFEDVQKNNVYNKTCVLKNWISTCESTDWCDTFSCSQADLLCLAGVSLFSLMVPATCYPVLPSGYSLKRGQRCNCWYMRTVLAY